MDAHTSKQDGAASEWFTPWRFGIILVLLLFAAFPKVMLGLEAFYYRDYGVLGYPFASHHHEAFWRGELPRWNPLSKCGAPFLAQWGTMTLYPFSLIYLIFPLPWSLSYFCLGHFMLGGLGMYALAQRWAGNRLGSSFAGVAYIFNGVTFSCLLWPNYTVALGWMPWVVLWVERSWREGGRWQVVAALAAAMQLLSGVPEVVLMTWLLLGCLWLDAMVRGVADRAALAKRLGLVVILVAGLTAAQLLPFFELLSHSQRDRSFTSSKWPMPGTGWANLLVPLFHCFETYSGSFFQYGQEFLTSYYPGATILVLAVWAGWRLRERRVWILAVLLVFGYVMALGENSFLFVGARQWFPLLKIVRYPVKFVLLPAFVLPLWPSRSASGSTWSPRLPGDGAR